MNAEAIHPSNSSVGTGESTNPFPRKSTGQVFREIRQHGMSIKRASELFASASPLIVGIWRVAVILCLAGLFFLKTVFPTKDEVTTLYGKLPAAVEKLTEIAAQQQRINEDGARVNAPNRLANLERIAEENRAVNNAQQTQLNATDRQLAVITEQLKSIGDKVDAGNRRLEKIADRIGSP
jgi:hypothetical protein